MIIANEALLLVNLMIVTIDFDVLTFIKIIKFSYLLLHI